MSRIGEVNMPCSAVWGREECCGGSDALLESDGQENMALRWPWNGPCCKGSTQFCACACMSTFMHCALVRTAFGDLGLPVIWPAQGPSDFQWCGCSGVQ